MPASADGRRPTPTEPTLAEIDETAVSVGALLRREGLPAPHAADRPLLPRGHARPLVMPSTGSGVGRKAMAIAGTMLLAGALFGASLPDDAVPAPRADDDAGADGATSLGLPAAPAERAASNATADDLPPALGDPTVFADLTAGTDRTGPASTMTSGPWPEGSGAPPGIGSAVLSTSTQPDPPAAATNGSNRSPQETSAGEAGPKKTPPGAARKGSVDGGDAGEADAHEDRTTAAPPTDTPPDATAAVESTAAVTPALSLSTTALATFTSVDAAAPADVGTAAVPGASLTEGTVDLPDVGVVGALLTATPVATPTASLDPIATPATAEPPATALAE